MIDYNDYLLQSEDYKYIDRYIDREMNIIYYNLFNHRLEDQNYRKNKVVNHILRHTVLSHFDECGVCIYLKFISNHKSINILDRYVKIDPNTIKKPIQKLWSKKSVKN